MASPPTENSQEEVTGYAQSSEVQDIYASKSPYDIIVNPTQLKRQRADKGHASIGATAHEWDCKAASRSPYLASAHVPGRLKEIKEEDATNQPGKMGAAPSHPIDGRNAVNPEMADAEENDCQSE